mgnify:FL=1
MTKVEDRIKKTTDKQNLERREITCFGDRSGIPRKNTKNSSQDTKINSKQRICNES